MEFIFSFVQRTTLKTLIQVYLTYVQDLVFQYRCAMLARNATAASVRRSHAACVRGCSVACERCTVIPIHQFLYRCRVDLY